MFKTGLVAHHTVNTDWESDTKGIYMMSFLPPTDNQEPVPDIENESWEIPGQQPPSSQPEPPKFSEIQVPSVSQKPSNQQYPSKEDVKPPVITQGEGQTTTVPPGNLTTSIP